MIRDKLSLWLIVVASQSIPDCGVRVGERSKLVVSGTWWSRRQMLPAMWVECLDNPCFIVTAWPLPCLLLLTILWRGYKHGWKIQIKDCSIVHWNMYWTPMQQDDSSRCYLQCLQLYSTIISKLPNLNNYLKFILNKTVRQFRYWHRLCGLRVPGSIPGYTPDVFRVWTEIHPGFARLFYQKFAMIFVKVAISEKQSPNVEVFHFA